MNNTKRRAMCAGSVVAAVAVLAACSADQAQRTVDEYRPKVKEAADTFASALAAYEDVKTKGTDTVAAWAVIRTTLPAEWSVRIDDAVARGVDAGTWLAAVVLQLKSAGDTMLAELDRLTETLATKQADDDATWDVVQTGLNVGLAVIGLPAVGALFNRRGKARGAAVVARAVARGRAANPDFDAAFNDPRLAAVMRITPAEPVIAAAVAANKVAK